MDSGGGCALLPGDIITDILKRLPVKSIVRFRCVCKQWKNLFKTPSFIAKHLSHSDRKNPFLLLHELNFERRCSSLRLLNHNLETAEVVHIPPIDSFRKHWWNIRGSCNGLLCVQVFEYSKKSSWSLFLWNPAIREVKRVPHAYDHHGRFCSVEFGFSSVINDYKILILSTQVVVEDGEIDGRIAVYSLSTDSWKELEFGPLRGTIKDLAASQSEAVSVDGTISWLFRNRLVSFDIATEVLTVTPIQTEDGIYLIGLSVHDNELYCHYEVLEESGHVSICLCMMEEVSSETEKIWKSTQKYRARTPYVPTFISVCIWRNDIVCLKKRETEVEGDPKYFLYLLDLITNEGREYNCPRASCWFYVGNYEKSLVSVRSTQAE